jgi:cobalt-zinc-cadmium efflux system membrane fusion protein
MPANVPDAPESPKAARAQPSRPRLVGSIAAAGVILAAVGIGIHVHRSGAEPAPAIGPDVPRAEGKAIVFSKGFRERAGIKVAIADKAQLKPLVNVVGTVTYDPEHVAAVGTRLRGLVRKLVRIEGDTVKEGDALAEIESAELGEAQASVAMLSAQKKASELNAARERDLSGRKLSTAREHELAEALLGEHQAMLTAAQQKVVALGGGQGGRFGVYVLRAPLAGTVVERNVSPGQSVEDHLVAYRVANLDHLWIELAVFEKNLAAIHKGDAVEVRPLADQEQVLEGTVAYVGDEIERTTRSASVRVKVDNRPRKLRPGQSVTAGIRTSGPARDAILVPREAITFVDGKPTVFVAEGDDRVVPTPVALGASDGERQEITGIPAGSRIVVEGVFALKSELFR